MEEKTEEKNNKSRMIKELQYLALIFLLLLVIFKIHYYKESISVMLNLTFSHFYLFIIPGYCLMLYYFDKLEFYQRFAIGLGLGYGVQPLTLYLINVTTEVNILKYNYYISGTMIIIGVILGYWKMKKK